MDGTLNLPQDAAQHPPGTHLGKRSGALLDQFMHGIFPTNRKCDLPYQRFASLFSTRDNARVDVRNQRDAQRGEFSDTQIRFKPRLRRLHQFAVKRGRNRQHHGALGATRGTLLDSTLDSFSVPRNYRLLRRVEIRWSHYLTIRSLAADFGDLGGPHAKNGSHGALTRWDRLLHILTPPTHKAYRVSKS